MPRLESMQDAAAMRIIIGGPGIDAKWLEHKVAGLPDAGAISAWAAAGHVPVVPKWMSAIRARASNDNRLLFRVVNYEVSILSRILAIGVFGLTVGYDCAQLIAAALADNCDQVRYLLSVKKYTDTDIALARGGHRLTLTQSCDAILAEWKSARKITLPVYELLFVSRPPARPIQIADSFTELLDDSDIDPPVVDMCTTDTAWIDEMA